MDAIYSPMDTFSRMDAKKFSDGRHLPILGVSRQNLDHYQLTTFSKNLEKRRFRHFFLGWTPPKTEWTPYSENRIFGWTPQNVPLDAKVLQWTPISTKICGAIIRPEIRNNEIYSKSKLHKWNKGYLPVVSSATFSNSILSFLCDY